MTTEMTLTVVETDGSNGYSPGTWEWRITETGTGTMSFDGGWPSRESALDAGQKALARLGARGPRSRGGRVVTPRSRAERAELHAMIESWERAPDSPVTCDLLCDVAETLGLPEGEYSVEELRDAIERTPATE